MNSEVIIGGTIIIGISLFFLLPGSILKIAGYTEKEETDLERITGNVVADSPNARQSNNALNNIKDSLNVLKSFTYPLFFPIFFIGIVTVFVGLRVD